MSADPFLDNTLTPSQGAGPFYSFSMMFDGCENACEPGSPDALTIEGQILDGDGNPITPPDAFLEILQGDQFARTMVDDEGRFTIVARKPKPTHLPDGRTQAPFFHVRVFVYPLAETHDTRMYFPDEAAANSTDPVLQLLDEQDRASMIPAPEGSTLTWVIRLSGPHQTSFLAPLNEPSLIDAGVVPFRPYREQAR